MSIVPKGKSNSLYICTFIIVQIFILKHRIAKLMNNMALYRKISICKMFQKCIVFAKTYDLDFKYAVLSKEALRIVQICTATWQPGC